MFGRLFKRRVKHIVLCDNPIPWASNIKYLGLNFISGKSLSLHVACLRLTLYMACNSIYAHSCKQNELAQFYLLESYSIPILTHCSAAGKLSIVAMS